MAFETTGTEDSSSAPNDRHYLALIERAAEYVQQRGGSVHEDELIIHVFGAGSSTSLWRPLLHNVLGDHPQIQLFPDGYWRHPHAFDDVATSGCLDFVAIDVETTGLGPSRHRVIEFAAIRFRGGIEQERFETLIQPDRRVPKYITKLTGLTDGHLDDAPRFADIAYQVVQFLGSETIIGHNVGFDFSFLNAELKRLERPTLINDRVDVMFLGMKLVPGLRRPTLERLANSLGLATTRVHRAGEDARLAGLAAGRLSEIAAQAGDGSLERLLSLSSPIAKLPKDGVGRARSVMDRDLLVNVPKRPGVYLMLDSFDHVIYVGKAKNLRDRVSSYFSQPLGYTRKMDGLAESMVKIDVEVTGSELEALMLESQLIKRYQPRYNTALRSFEHYPYIRIDVSNPWPHVTLVGDRKPDGARYFGPFRSTSSARKTVDLINSVLPLRTCSRSFKNARSYGSPCIQLDLGRCLGPCLGRADSEIYRRHVRKVTSFLEGDSEILREEIWSGLEEAAARLDFEKARRLRDELLQAEALSQAQARLLEAEQSHTLLLVQPSAEPNAREVFLVIRGRLWAQVRADMGRGPRTLAVRLEASWNRATSSSISPVDYDTIDEANILNRWLFRYAGHPAILAIEPPDKPDWKDLSSRAFALSVEDLEFNDRDASSEIDEVLAEASLTP
ncbi:MAG: exonuclease domain-containing protein [Thermomicrobiales bacterium]